MNAPMSRIEHSHSPVIEFRKKLLSQVAIVLVRPAYPENVGAAARVACNMGISRLILVGKEKPDEERMRKLATHHARHLIDGLEIFSRLDEALAPFQWVVGTSARQGRQRHTMAGPKTAMVDLVPKLVNNQAALLFGPEDRGLSNDDLKLCNIVTTIPTADFSSLNLAQAVALLAYELYSEVLRVQQDNRPAPARLACNRERETLYGLIEEALRAIGYLQEERYGYWMHNIRHFLGRTGLRSREARFVGGFCKQIIDFSKKNERNLSD